jgi:hypothetical protein
LGRKVPWRGGTIDRSPALASVKGRVGRMVQTKGLIFLYFQPPLENIIVWRTATAELEFV